MSMSGVRARWGALGGVGKAAVVLGALASIVLVVTLIPVVGAVFIPSAESSVSKAAGEELDKQYKLAFDDYLKQFDGRSLFFTPAPPTSEQPPEPEPAEDTTPKEKPKPTTYGGPSIIAMINDAVWFDNGKKMKVGAEAADDMRVLRVQAPWEATIEWKGVEFAVNFIARDGVVLHKGEKKESSSNVVPGTTIADPTEMNKPASKPSTPVTPATPPAPGAPAAPAGETPKPATPAPADAPKPNGDPPPPPPSDPNAPSAPPPNPPPAEPTPPAPPQDDPNAPPPAPSDPPKDSRR